MKKRKLLCFALSLVMLVAMLGSLPSVSASETGTAEYVQDGLVSWFKGGETSSTSAWEDIISGYDLAVVTNQNNYFTEDGFRVNGQKHYFSNELVELVNGNQFTIEIEFGDFEATGGDYNVFMNSSNDHFSLFRRVSEDVIEWKFGNGSTRPKIAKSMRYLPNHVLTFTCEYGGSVIMYVDGVEMARADCDLYMGANDLFIGQIEESRSYNALYKNIRFYSRALTPAEVEQNVVAAGYVPEIEEWIDYVSIAQPTTRIVGDVGMVRPVNSLAELDAMMAADALPASAIYEINESLQVLDENGQPFSTVSEVLEKTQYRVLSCFSIRDRRTADALAKYLNTLYFFDVQLMSADKDILKYAREHLPSCYGILDLRGKYENVSDLSEEQLLDIRRTIKAYNGHIAVLPVALCKNTDVQYLYDRQVNVWAWGTDQPDMTEQYYALLSGAIGVVSDATASYLDIACNQLAKNTLTRVPANTGHRGIPTQAPECTLEGSILAYELGATVIEMDVYLTTDGHVVAMHDSTTGRTCNQDLRVEESTLAELKQLYVNKGYEEDPTYSACRIPTLAEYLEWFKQTDCLLFIEIKSGNTDIVPAIKALVEEYDMYGQCTVITFNHNIMATMRSDYPEMPVGCLGNGMMAGLNADEDIPTVMAFIGQYNGTHNPEYGSYVASDLRACLIRGVSVYPWTIPENSLVKLYLGGFNSLTNNVADFLGEIPHSIAPADQLTLRPNETSRWDFLVTRYDRSTVTAAASEIILLEGEAEVQLNRITPTTAGDVTFMAVYSYNLLHRATCVMYTQPITLSARAEDEETTSLPETDPAESEEITTESDSQEGTTDITPPSDGCTSAVRGLAALPIILVAALTVSRKRKED